jgi:hypothetical protein
MIPITDILRQIRKGVGVTEASEQMQEVIKACMATGKPGELTIKLKVTPDKAATGRQMVSSAQFEVEMGVTSKMPKLPIPKAIFFGTVEGELLRDDPEQSPLFGNATDREMRAVGE